MKVLNFLLRMVFGAIGIQIINAILISQNIAVFVGLNALTLLTVGGLGISGGTGEEDHSLAEYGLSVLNEVL